MKHRLFNKVQSPRNRHHLHDLRDQKTIHDLKNGEPAKIKDIIGGRHFINKAESLGIRQGVQISKVSSQMMRGPVTVKVGQTQIAIGHRMAKKIIVE